MKIFLPFQQELNPYLEEIIRFSENDFHYGSLEDYNRSFEIVNIHWPEAIFKWLEPSEMQLKDLEKRILEWKEHSTLVYTKHDFERNKGTTANFSKLFELIEVHADVFIHLGKYSRDHYQKKFPRAVHEIVYHPLYRNSFKIVSKSKARRDLKISQDSLVIIVPGNIRSYQERDLILKAYKSLSKLDKVLICTNMHSELRLDFPGRVKLKRLIDIKRHLVDRFRSKHQPPEFVFTYHNISHDKLELKMAASDIVFIPRFKNLNSGMLFLGLTYGKTILGPECGNIKEQLEDIGYPTFKPRIISSAIKALEKAVILDNSLFKPSENILDRYDPQNVALEMDAVFKKSLIR